MTRLEDFLKLNKNRQIWTISKDQSVMQALILMSEKNIGAIIIVDNNDFPIGIFSERDYARKIILKGKSSKDTLLDEVMTKELITVTRDYKIDQCMEIMIEKKIRHLPVLEDKKIIGIISIGDLLKIHSTIDQISESVRTVIIKLAITNQETGKILLKSKMQIGFTN